MIVFGLTGGIAVGKSTVTRTFRNRGIPMIDADIVARQVVELGTPGLQTITDMFGAAYLQPDGTLDRTRLGQLVFSNHTARQVMNSIMAPLITNEATAQFKKLQEEGCSLCGWDAALICEMGHQDKYRPLIVVHCLREIQLERLMKRNQLTEAEAMSRIEAQMPVEKKVAMADYTIDTSGTIEYSVQQTEKIILSLRGLKT